MSPFRPGRVDRSPRYPDLTFVGGVVSKQALRSRKKKVPGNIHRRFLLNSLSRLPKNHDRRLNNEKQEVGDGRTPRSHFHLSNLGASTPRTLLVARRVTLPRSPPPRTKSHSYSGPGTLPVLRLHSRSVLSTPLLPVSGGRGRLWTRCPSPHPREECVLGH